MNEWTASDLDIIAGADELDVAPQRPDGTPLPHTTIWVVRVGHNIYVRSYRGRHGAWFRRAIDRDESRVHIGDIERDVTFEQRVDTDRQAIDDAYRRKYAGYSPTYVEAMVSPAAAEATLRVIPAERKEGTNVRHPI